MADPFWTRRRMLAAMPGAMLAGCGAAARDERPRRWTRLIEAAPFPGAYNFPVHVARDGRFVALHPQGNWSSRNGRDWVREPLPLAGTQHAYLPYVQHDGATWVLAQVSGDYLDFAIDPVVRRTGDYRRWKVVGRSPNLPRLVFPAVASFRGALWLIGGFDGTRETAAIWRSADGLDWRRVVDRAPWQPSSRGRAVVFRDRLWLIGGSTIDGPVRSEVWSSADGLAWRREAERLADPQPFGYSAEVFDDLLWLVGANRAGGFGSGMLVSDDGRRWTAVTAPWSPRGLPATWVADGRLWLTGGKYSYPVSGEQRFVYSHDVWAMTASA